MKLQNWEELKKWDPQIGAAVYIIKLITQMNPNYVALIVGGAVRDILRGRPPGDIDIATNCPISEITPWFDTYDIGKSKDFGIVVINNFGFNFEVAHFRKDGTYSDKRRPDTVELIETFEDDSARRDFTINSMGINQAGELIDYHGGFNDLQLGQIKTVGDPRKRFGEDSLRILRAARFAAKLDFTIEEETFKVMVEMKESLNQIAKERITKELWSAAESGRGLARFIEILDQTGILPLLFPELAVLKPLQHAIIHHPEGGGLVLGHVLEAVKKSRVCDPQINIAILLHDVGKGTTYVKRGEKHTYYGHEAAGVPIIEEMGKRLKWPTFDVKAFQFGAANHMLVHKLGELSAPKIMEITDHQFWRLLKEVSYADEASRGEPLFNHNDFERKIEVAEARRDAMKRADEELLHDEICGTNLLNWFPLLNENKYKPLIGKILKALHDWAYIQVDSYKQVTRSSISARAQQLFNSYKGMIK